MPHAVARLIGLLIVASFVLGFSAPARAASAPWEGTFNTYRDGVFVTQYTWTWCVGAGSQAMLNIINNTTNTSRKRQRNLVNYAMNNDEHFDSNSGGSDAVGFAQTLVAHGAGDYQPKTWTKYRKAVRQAVKRIRATGKPVGLLVMGGRHVWVMTGFDATADPAVTNRFDVTGVYVMGSLYPKQTKGYFDMAPNTRLTWKQFKTPFRRFDDPDSPRFVGYWVTVSP